MAKGILCISNMNIIIIILAITTRLEAVVASQYRAFDGCSKNTQNDFEDLNPGYYHVLSRPAEMVCCSMDGSSCSRKNQGICRSGSGDSYKATWMEANQNCLNSCGTGCNYDNQLVWSNIEQASSSSGIHCDEKNPPYVGCFSDDGDRDLSDGPKKYGYDQSTCNKACKNYNYFALQAGGWCVCGDSYGNKPQYEQKCDKECGGPRGMGKGWRNSIYKTCIKPEFELEIGIFCPYCNSTYNTMEEAKDACRNDPKCNIIYDLFCDNVGYFCICPMEALIKQIHPNGIDCVYKR